MTEREPTPIEIKQRELARKEHAGDYLEEYSAQLLAGGGPKNLNAENASNPRDYLHRMTHRQHVVTAIAGKRERLATQRDLIQKEIKELNSPQTAPADEEQRQLVVTDPKRLLMEVSLMHGGISEVPLSVQMRTTGELIRQKPGLVRDTLILAYFAPGLITTVERPTGMVEYQEVLRNFPSVIQNMDEKTVGEMLGGFSQIEKGIDEEKEELKEIMGDDESVKIITLVLRHLFNDSLPRLIKPEEYYHLINSRNLYHAIWDEIEKNPRKYELSYEEEKHLIDIGQGLKRSIDILEFDPTGLEEKYNQGKLTRDEDYQGRIKRIRVYQHIVGCLRLLKEEEKLGRVPDGQKVPNADISRYAQEITMEIQELMHDFPEKYLEINNMFQSADIYALRAYHYVMTPGAPESQWYQGKDD